ncbi:unnamed protein product [Urochloa decumbens]|uniref:DUF569 domain-containing protein n=1 Tax=Urochloa decumbens TaxID=240449 RepID=A0ABC9E5A3_9POAL
MELFPDGAHVRLRSRVHGYYLYAEEHEVEAAWSPDWASLNAAWAVHRVVRPGGIFFLLRSAAYGRYLRLTSRGDPSADLTLAQRSYTTLRKHGVMWQAFYSEDGTGDVVLRNRKYGRLRIRWIVEDIPPREDPPELPEVAPDSDYCFLRSDVQLLFAALQRSSTCYRSCHSDVLILSHDVYLESRIGYRSLNMLSSSQRVFRISHSELSASAPLQQPPWMPGAPMRVRAPPVLRRRIWYMRADDQAELDALVWSRLRFNGRSVSNLRDELAAALGEANSQNITLCVQAGYRARLTPLVIDLPDNERTMEIVVLTTGSEGKSLEVLSVACQPVQHLLSVSLLMKGVFS